MYWGYKYNDRSSTLWLRISVAIILLVHSLPGMFNGGVRDFGNFFLNDIGFAPYGIPLAYAIKIVHVICAVLLLLNRYVLTSSLMTIFILVVGIVLVHFKEGWFVVGGGRNGVEFNVLLIFVLFQIIQNTRRKK